MAIARTIFPSRPSSEETFIPPTEQEKEMFAEKIVECCTTEEDGHEHALVRLVYAVKTIAVTEERRANLHKHLYMFENVDEQLLREAEALGLQIDAEMQKEIPPKTKEELESATQAEKLPKTIFVQRYMDNKVGKLAVTFVEFKNSYEVAAMEPLPKEI